MEEPRPKSRTATIINKIHAVKSLDELFCERKNDLVDLFDVEQLILYAVDSQKRELYVKYLLHSFDRGEEMRVPINDTSVPGYCARYGKILNIADAYDSAELAVLSPHMSFDPSWDKRSGFRTRQMLAVPILVERKYLLGVLLLLNRRKGGRFTAEDEGFVTAITETLGLAMRNQRQVAAQRRRATKFDYLLEQQLITPQELNTAIAEARPKAAMSKPSCSRPTASPKPKSARP